MRNTSPASPAATKQQTEVSAREAHQRKHIAAGECGCVLSRLRRPASPFYGVREERRRAMPISWGTRERLHSQRLWSQVWLATNAECGRQWARTGGAVLPSPPVLPLLPAARSPIRTAASCRRWMSSLEIRSIRPAARATQRWSIILYSYVPTQRCGAILDGGRRRHQQQS